MRSLKELVNQYERIWFSVGSDDDLQLQFMTELEEHGYHWVSQKPVVSFDRRSFFMGIGPNKSVGIVTWQIWRVSWLNEEANPDNRDECYRNGKAPVRIDYEKYSRGDEDYFVHENIVKNVGGFLYQPGGKIILIDE